MKKLFLLLIALIIATPAYSAVEWVRKSYFDFSGGLNDTFSAVQIKDNEAVALDNVVFDTTGHFETRPGYAKLNSSTVGASIACVGLEYYEPINGNQYLVTIFDDDTIQKMDYTGGVPDGTWDDITGALSFSLDANTLVSFAIGEDTLIIEDGIGTTAPYKWTGTGNASALGGSPPNATMVAYHKLHAFAAGNSTNPSTLYFSDLGDIENWTTGLSGNIEIETNDGSIIRAIKPCFDALCILKDDSIWRLTGDDKDNFELRRMIPDEGTLSHQSVGQIGSDLIFFSGQGDVFIYDGAFKVAKLSKKIEGTLKALNFSRFQYAKGIAYDENYYLSVSSASATEHDTVLYYDSFHNAWSSFSNIDANAFTVADDGAGEDVLVFCDYGGFVYQYPLGTDDAGTNISTSLTTKQFFFPDVGTGPNKDFKKLYLYLDEKNDYDFTTEIMKDFESSGASNTVNLQAPGATWDSAVYGVDVWGGGNLIIGEIEPNLSGKFFQLKFSASQPIEVKGYEMFIDPSDFL